MGHSTEIAVRFYELDPYEHVNHSVYIQYFEAARAQWLTEVGFPLHRLKADGIQIVVTELNTRYLGSAGPDDILMVTSELHELRRVSMSFVQKIVRQGTVIVEQTISAAAVTTQGRLTRIPSDLARALSADVSS